MTSDQNSRNCEHAVDQAKDDLRTLFRRTAPGDMPLDKDAVRRKLHDAEYSLRFEQDPVSNEPSNEVVSANRSKTSLFTRRSIVIMRIATTLAIVVGITLASLMVLNPDDRNAAYAYSDVKQSLKGIKSISCDVVQTLPNGRSIKIAIAFQGKNLIRAEIPNGDYAVTDLLQHKKMKVLRRRKRVIIQEGYMESDTTNPFDIILNAEKDSTKGLGVKTLDGKKVDVYLLKIVGEFGVLGEEYSIWVDQKTKRPVRMENETLKKKNAKRPAYMPLSIVFINFKFNQPFGKSHFKLIPPQGFDIDVIKNLAPEPTDNRSKSSK